MPEKQSKSGIGGKREGAGRKPGVPNKATGEVKAAIAAFTSANVDKLDEWLNSIDDPAKRLDLYFKALEYTMPKLARSELVGDKEQPIQVVLNQFWAELHYLITGFQGITSLKPGAICKTVGGIVKSFGIEEAEKTS